ncbi:MAG: nickel pincer cofactor biosynthesis protein LarC [Candidatus Onthomonas sp.]
MKTLYLECNMGAAGDMLAAALLELHPDPEDFVRRLNHLGLPGVVFSRESAVKCGITGTHLSVTVHGEEEQSLDVSAGETHGHAHSHSHDHGADGHHHHTLAGITHLVSHLSLPQPVRNNVLAVYQLLAQAEGHVHGKSVEEIHFHEVGALDAVADITAVCLLFHELDPERIAASPVQVGSGQVRCAHGILPVPAPAAAWLLQGIPTFGGSIQGELCTPTGAALLRHFVQSFGPQPVMQVERIGYGMGAKDFPQANCVRAMLGEARETAESICELRCNLDDMTPEAVGFAMERLLEAGALDVFTAPIGMKKCRPGVLLTVLCRPHQREELLRLLFLHTTTLGVRESDGGRYVLTRRTRTEETAAGPVRVKQVSGWGVRREKPEYEDLARIARERGCSLAQAEAFVAEPPKSN